MSAAFFSPGKCQIQLLPYTIGTNSGRFQMEEPEREVDLEDVGEPEAESSCEPVPELPAGFMCCPLFLPVHVVQILR